MEKIDNFFDLGLSNEILEVIKQKGFEKPSHIQVLTIPILLKNEKDIIGQAQTGTGKTAAFGLPIIENTKKNGITQVLVLAPTRELAIQVAEEMISFRTNREIGILPVYGGQSIEGQLRRLKRGVEIVVGTPGRILDHLKRRTLKIDRLSYMVLDEADEMLNMGFIEDIEKILSQTNEDKRMLLFSATIPQRIVKLAQKFMSEYEEIKIDAKRLTVDLTDQIYFEVNSSDKFEALCRIIDIEKEFYALIFCRTKLKAQHLGNALSDRGYYAAALHGDISQPQRERILDQFRKKKIRILAATDVAARGIDIQELTHVLNYSIPQDPESYVHRIGRTGRAGKRGTAITFITPSEYRKLMHIQRTANAEIRKEKIPKVKQLINLKRKRIIEEISEIIEKKTFDDNLHIAYELLGNHKSDEIIAALLTHAYKDDFSPEKYAKIRGVKATVENTSPDLKGTTRLFIALGNKNSITKKKLVDMIKKETLIDSRLIRDIKVYDNFSFANVPFAEAEQIIKAFRKMGGKKKPLVVKAKSEEKKRKTNFSKSRRKRRY
ncbi:MAG: DEAD/DEAH box helicase [Candidatus Cloacimonetes bacterium]|nr:DEAD/DEAH box helicase [Candidatus Cloacimonadota bacterium]